jgi:hypothetical protein
VTSPIENEGYRRTLKQMEDAARAWINQRPFAELRFASVPAVLRAIGAPEYVIAQAEQAKRPAIAAALQPLIEHWAMNEDTRSFLQALVDGTNGEVTFLQASALVGVLLDQHLDRASHVVEVAGRDNHCPACAQELGHATNVSGRTFAPTLGCLTICGCCAARLRFTETGFELLTDRDFGRLHKRQRTMLADLQKVVRKAKAEQHEEKLQQN